jgi:O-antigen/teichoic acid export membrane protein
MLSLLRSLANDSMFDALRTRLRSVGHLLTGNMAEALLGLAVVAIAARSLGPTDYGLLVLAFSYARALERLISFQSWQPLVKYGAPLLAEEDREQLKSLLKFGLLLDLAGALASFLIGIGLALAGGALFGWSDSLRTVLFICCLMLPFRLAGMPTAGLRIHGAFKSIAWIGTAGTAIRLAGSLAAMLMGGGITAFAIAWAGSQILASLLFLGAAFSLLKDRGITDIRKASVRNISSQFKGIWRFAISTNISLTLRSSANQLDIFIVGALAGPAAAGLYHIAKRAGRMAEQISVQAQAVLFPDVTRLWAKRDIAEFRRAALQMEFILVGFGVLCTIAAFVLGKPLLTLALGPDFSDTWGLVVVQMLAVTAMMAGVGSRAGLLAMGKDGKVLQATMAGTILFHVSAFLLVPQLGAIGANWAHVLLGLVYAGLMMVWFRQALRAAA